MAPPILGGDVGLEAGLHSRPKVHRTSVLTLTIHLVPLSSVIVPAPAPMRVVSGRKRARRASQMTHIAARARLRKSNIAGAHPFDPPFAVLFEGRQAGRQAGANRNMHPPRCDATGRGRGRE